MRDTRGHKARSEPTAIAIQTDSASSLQRTPQTPSRIACAANQPVPRDRYHSPMFHRRPTTTERASRETCGCQDCSTMQTTGPATIKKRFEQSQSQHSVGQTRRSSVAKNAAARATGPFPTESQSPVVLKNECDKRATPLPQLPIPTTSKRCCDLSSPASTMSVRRQLPLTKTIHSLHRPRTPRLRPNPRAMRD